MLLTLSTVLQDPDPLRHIAEEESILEMATGVFTDLG
jgi:hypothetical protein